MDRHRDHAATNDSDLLGRLQSRPNEKLPSQGSSRRISRNRVGPFDSQRQSNFRFKAEPMRLSGSAEGLALTIGRSNYWISRWPQFDFFYSTALGAPRLVPQSLRPALRHTLETLRLEHDQSRRVVAYGLVRDLPLWVHARLVPMQDHYWLGVETLARFPQSTCLLEASPALFSLFAHFSDQGLLASTPPETIDTLLRSRQRSLLRWLGFGWMETHCKILRRFSTYRFTFVEWNTLMRNLRTPEVVRLLQHTPVVPPAALEFLSGFELVGLLTPRAIADFVSASISKGGFFGPRLNIDEVFSTAVLLRRYGLVRSPLSSIAEYKFRRAQMNEQLDHLPIARGPTIDEPGVAPIRTVGELRDEGREMSHCVGDSSFIHDALRGTACFYRIDQPIRATLSLRRHNGLGKWRPSQLSGPANARIDKTSRQAILDKLPRDGAEV